MLLRWLWRQGGLWLVAAVVLVLLLLPASTPVLLGIAFIDGLVVVCWAVLHVGTKAVMASSRQVSIVRQRAHGRRQYEINLRETDELNRKAKLERSRRENARVRCDILFALHAAEIGTRFTRQDFDGFVSKYMSDRHPVEDVERHADELRQMIEHHRDRVRPRPKQTTLQDLAAWFLAEKGRIEALPLDRDLMELHLVRLSQRYAELTERLLESIEP